MEETALVDCVVRRWDSACVWLPNMSMLELLQNVQDAVILRSKA